MRYWIMVLTVSLLILLEAVRKGDHVTSAIYDTFTSTHIDIRLH